MDFFTHIGAFAQECRARIEKLRRLACAARPDGFFRFCDSPFVHRIAGSFQSIRQSEPELNSASVEAREEVADVDYPDTHLARCQFLSGSLRSFHRARLLPRGNGPDFQGAGMALSGARYRASLLWRLPHDLAG